MNFLKKEVVMANDISARPGYKLVFTPYVTRNERRSIARMVACIALRCRFRNQQPNLFGARNCLPV